MMRRAAAVLLGVLITLLACHPTAEERSVVRRWLLCEECREGELDSVVALGDRATGALAEALRGPPAAGRENVRNQAIAMFRRSPGISPFSQQQYVNRFVANYVATYQSRSVVALGQIGTPKAHAVLLQAVQSDTAYRDDVLKALGAAAQLSLSRFAGDGQSAPLDSFVLIKPTVLVRDSTTGHPLGNVQVVFRVDSGGGRVVDSVQRTSPNGLASVRWMLGATDSINVLRAVAAGRIVQFHAAGHGYSPRIVFTTQPSNGRINQPIVPAVRVAVLDPWGRLDSTFSSNAIVNVPGTAFSLAQPIVAGQAGIPGLILNFTGTGLRLRVTAIGATPAISGPFDVTP